MKRLKLAALIVWRFPWRVIGIAALFVLCVCLLACYGRRASLQTWDDII